jgi:hypothetical protein
MTTTVLLTHTAVPAPGAQSVMQVPLGSDQGEDLYALWQAVFETSHPAATAGDEGPHAQSVDPAPQSDPQASTDTGSEHRTLPTQRVDGAADVYEPPALVAAGNARILQSLVPSGVGGTRSVADTDVQASGESAGEPALLMPQDQHVDTAVDPAQVAMATDDAGQPPEVEQSAQLERDLKSVQGTRATSDAGPPGVADSVNVFVQGTAVAIVVRDATLSDQDAVTCAFETARQLTGHSEALQSLTLNGRTLYQQKIQADPRIASSPPALLFDC